MCMQLCFKTCFFDQLRVRCFSSSSIYFVLCCFYLFSTCHQFPPRSLGGWHDWCPRYRVEVKVTFKKVGECSFMDSMKFQLGVKTKPLVGSFISFVHCDRVCHCRCCVRTHPGFKKVSISASNSLSLDHSNTKDLTVWWTNKLLHWQRVGRFHLPWRWNLRRILCCRCSHTT